MLPEALVIFACLNGTGCQETSSHYYNSSPTLQQSVQNGETKVTKYVSPVLIQTVGPAAFIAFGGTGNVRLDRHFSLQLNKQKGILIFSKEF